MADSALDIVGFKDVFQYVKSKNKNTNKLTKNYRSIWDIEDQQDDICMFAIDQNMRAFKHIRNRSLKVISFMYRKYGCQCIKYLFIAPKQPY
jgi:hypothetical protein